MVRCQRVRAKRISGRRIAVNVVCLVTGCLWATGAAAHPEFNPSVTNRYLKFDLVSPTEIRFVYTVLYGAAPAAALRAAADANGDGRLDDAESRTLGARVAALVGGGLALDLDGRRIAPAFEEPAVGLVGAEVGPAPFSVDLVARLPFAATGEHTVRFDDTTPLPLLGETEVRIEEGPGTRLIVAHRGAEGSERETRFLFRGPKFSVLEDRSITFRFGASGVPATKATGTRARWPFPVAAGLSILCLTFAVSYGRRRRRR
jgi:hypothetical protein